MKQKRFYSLLMALALVLATIFASTVSASAAVLPELDNEPYKVAIDIEDEPTEVNSTEAEPADEIPATNEVVDVPLKGIQLIHREYRRFTLYFYTLFTHTNEAETPMWLSASNMVICISVTFIACMGLRVCGEIIVAFIAEFFRFLTPVVTALIHRKNSNNGDSGNNGGSGDHNADKKTAPSAS